MKNGNAVSFKNYLLGKKLNFLVKISHAENLPEKFGRDVYCTYDMEHLDGKEWPNWPKTDEIKGAS